MIAFITFVHYKRTIEYYSMISYRYIVVVDCQSVVVYTVGQVDSVHYFSVNSSTSGGMVMANSIWFCR